MSNISSYKYKCCNCNTMYLVTLENIDHTATQANWACLDNFYGEYACEECTAAYFSQMFNQIMIRRLIKGDFKIYEPYIKHLNEV